MDDLRFDARMSDTEALVWSLEEHNAARRSTIAVIAFLDRSPGMEALRARLERVTRVLPRFRDRVVPGIAAFSPPAWEADPSFDLSFHLRGVQLPSASGLDGVLRWAEPIVAEGLDRSRPLWQITLVEGRPEPGAAIILKLHHTFTDGIGLVKLAALLFDFDPDAVEPAELPPLAQFETRSPFGRLAGEVTSELRRSLTLARRSVPAVAGGLAAAFADPEHQATATVDLIRSFAHLAAPTMRPLSPVLTSRSLCNRFEVLDAPLDGARAAARAAGGTVNDAFLAALLAGLRLYHERHGSWPDALRVGIPISTRRAGTEHSMRNQFVPVRVVLPLQESDPAARIRDVHERVAGERAQPVLAKVEQLAGLINRLPAARGLLAATMASVDVVASNVPGSDVPMYLHGSRVTRIVPFGPRNGAALNATVVSYDGALHLGLNIDAVAIPDHDILVDSLRKGLAETIGS